MDCNRDENVSGEMPCDVENKHIFDFSRVRSKEFEHIAARRAGRNWPVNEGRAAPDLFGIALSGGGVRSASFCLGALQALDAFGLIRRADYLSTVSGGGYIGAGMIAAMTRQSPDKEITFPYAANNGTKEGSADGNDMRDSEAVSHTRDHSRYLIPHGLSDILLSVGVMARGLAVNFLLIFFLLIPLATLTVLANPTLAHLDRSAVYDIAIWFCPTAAWLQSLNGESFLGTKFLAAFLLTYLISWGLWRSLGERHNFRNWSAEKEISSAGVRFASGVIVTLIACAAFEAQGPILRRLAKSLEEAPAEQWGYQTLFITLFAFVTATAGQQQRLANWIQKGMNDPTIGAKVKSIFSKLALVAASLILPLLIYSIYLFISLWGITGTFSIGSFWIGGYQTETFSVVTNSGPYVFAPSFLVCPKTTWVLLFLIGLLLVWEVFIFAIPKDGQQTLILLKRRIHDRRQELARKALIAILFCAFVVLATIATRPSNLWVGAEPWRELNPAYLVALHYLLATVLITLLTMNFANNANSLHRLYRDRLNVAFRLGDDASDAQVASLRLHKLSERAPYLLINATLNARLSATKLAGAITRPNAREAQEPSLDPVKRGRNAEFFVFSKYFVGSDATKYTSPECMRDPDLNLATAVAISGAAVSSNMGRVGLGLLSPTLALLNLRLGYWLNNPLHAGVRIQNMPTHLPWHDFFGAYLIAECFGLLRTNSSKIYVTDGGHIDNIGLYQLLKRQCDQIVVIDAEADPALNFGALVDVQRFARIDLGYRIDIDWSQLREAAAARAANKGKRAPAGEDKIHNCHFAVGTILYGKDDKGIEKKGTLLYVKALMTGDEPDYVLDYERRFPAFPHEATSDQFFSEEQMEAYRALGFHAVRRALTDPEPATTVPTDHAEAKAPKPYSVYAKVKEMKEALGIGVSKLS